MDDTTEDLLRKRLIKAKALFGDDEDVFPFAAAMAVMAVLTGPQFQGRNLEASAMQDSFLGISHEGLADHFQWRFQMLADALFNLRDHTGFSVLIERLEMRNLRPVFFEAQAAALMAQAGFSVALRPENGVRGDDFDFTAQLGEASINCEVTAFSTPEFGATTIQNALKHKRKQLPPDKPALVFCTLAEGWLERGVPTAELDQIASGFLKGTRRVNAVVFCWDAFMKVPPTGWAYAHVTRPTLNPRPRHAVDLGFLSSEHADAEAMRRHVLGGPMPKTELEFLSYARTL